MSGIIDSVVVTQRGSVRIHSYIAPENGWAVSTQIVEGPTSLIAFDGQLLDSYAEQSADYIASLGKPVDRFIVSHAHPDHWAGMQTMARRFPGVPIYSLPGVATAIKERGPAIIGGLKQLLGPEITSVVTVPSHEMKPDLTIIDGIEFDFREIRDAESELQLIAIMPRQKILLSFDLIFSGQDHIFTTIPSFKSWIETLQSIKEMHGYDLVVIGHGKPTDRSSIEATIAYLKQAGEAYVSSNDGPEYAKKLQEAFPDRRHPEWIEFSANILYSAAGRQGSRAARR